MFDSIVQHINIISTIIKKNLNSKQNQKTDKIQKIDKLYCIYLHSTFSSIYPSPCCKWIKNYNIFDSQNQKLLFNNKK